MQVKTSMVRQVAAVVVAAGTGTRFGGAVPKAFVELAGEPMFLRSLRVLAAHAATTETVLVVAGPMRGEAKRLLDEAGLGDAVAIVDGGEHRWQSVRNGVAATSCEWVCVHDAARPLVTPQVVDRLIEKAGTYRAVITATPMDDTVREFAGDRAGATLDRRRLVRVGTPQVFEKGALQEAFDGAEAMTPPPTDEAILMEARGIAVGIAWGDPRNFKITSPEDLALAEAIVAARA
jgi:2-C-methyl-D-erythritol 4-phosphate cytidylyltransferase